MERRFEVRKREILRDADIRPGVSNGMLKRLEQFAHPFVASLGRREVKDNARIYLHGLLSDVERKNAESIAYRHDRPRRALQRFVGSLSWAVAPLQHELVRQVGMELGEADGVLVVDPSAFPKCGTESVGVQRQWLGRLGKVDNGQVGIYLGYVSRPEYALVDERLYLPKSWAGDRVRCRKCGVPKTIRYQTRHALALEMLKTNGPLLPHAWIAGDDEMGRSSGFRRDLRALKERYLLAVPSNTGIRDLDSPPPTYGGRGQPPKQPFQRVDRWRDTVNARAWTKVEVRDGEKGPLGIELVTRRVIARTERRNGKDAEELLIVARTPEGKTDYYLSNASANTPPEELARAIKAEHRIEDSFQRAKSEAGLSDYEVRSWAGWHHHQILSLIALWFLIVETRRGKKIYAGVDGPGGSDPAGQTVASRVRPGVPRLGDPPCPAKKPAARTGPVLPLQAT